MTLMPLVRVTSFYDQVKVLLDTSTLGDILGGLHRIYRADEDTTKPEVAGNSPWGRIVLVPTQNLWGDDTSQQTLYRKLSFLVRAELNRYVSPGYDSSYILEAVQKVCYDQLEQAQFTTTDLLVTLPVYLFRPPQALPMWDDGRQLWFTSAEYRGEVGLKR